MTETKPHTPEGAGHADGRGRPRRRQRRHGVEGPERQRTDAARDAPAGAGRGSRRSDFRPNQHAQSLHSRPELDGGPDHHGRHRPLQHPGAARRRGRARRGQDLRAAVRHPRRRHPRTPPPAEPHGPPGGRHHRHRPPHRPARRRCPALRRRPRRLRAVPLHRPVRTSRSSPTTQGGARLAVEHLHRHRPHPHRARHRPRPPRRRPRPGPATRRGPAGEASLELVRRAASTSATGARRGAGARPTRCCARPPAPTPSSAATTRSPAGWPTPCASEGWRVPDGHRRRRLRQLGHHGAGRPAAAHHHRHEPRRDRPDRGPAAAARPSTPSPGPACTPSRAGWSSASPAEGGGAYGAWSPEPGPRPDPGEHAPEPAAADTRGGPAGPPDLHRGDVSTAADERGGRRETAATASSGRQAPPRPVFPPCDRAARTAVVRAVGPPSGRGRRVIGAGRS